jgi:hypothetical protein
MKRAMSFVDSSDLGAAEFSAQNLPWIDSRRGKLACMGCGAPAFFRAGSATRRPAFGATHVDSCALVSPRWSVFRFLQ